MEKYQSDERMQNEHEQQTETWRDKVIEQIVTIRDTGLTNMFDVKNVFELALSMDFVELADFTFMNKVGYAKFILTGDRNQLAKPPI